jgi:hypothetical protein
MQTWRVGNAALIVSSVVAGVVGGVVVGPVHAGIITDPSFFASIPTTAINFETNGAGAPVVLIQAQSVTMPANEYAALGINVGANVAWVNDGSPVFDAAQAIGGTLDNALISPDPTFTITFLTTTRSVAFFVVNNRGADAAGPHFTARDAQGNILEAVVFSPTFLDGTITGPNVTADYGFMGVFSSTPIASLTVVKQAAIFDNLRFSPLPAPGALALLGAGGLLAMKRRR